MNNHLKTNNSAKRIIACLDIKDGKVVKGVNFKGLKEVGSPLEMAVFYQQEGADELVLLDISATAENRKTAAGLVKEIAGKLNIPVVAGGGIASVDDARTLFEAGAGKVAVNSAAVQSPQLITQLSSVFGTEKIIAAVDAKRYGNDFFVMIRGGAFKTALKAGEWAAEVEKLGAGEILLTSTDTDGVKSGFDLELTQRVCRSVQIPVIASGGAGKAAHFTELFEQTTAAAALAAGIFHYGEVSISGLKNELRKNRIAVQ